MRAHAESVNLQFEQPLDEVIPSILIKLFLSVLPLLYFRNRVFICS